MMSESRPTIRRHVDRASSWLRPLAARASRLGEVSLGLLLPVVTVGLMFAANCGAPDVVRRAQPAGGSGGQSSSSSSEGTAGVAGSTASTPPEGGSSHPGSAGSSGGPGGTSVAGGAGAAGGASTTGGKGGTGGASATGGKGGTSTGGKGGASATGGKGGAGGGGGTGYIGASGITTSPFGGSGGASGTPDTSAGGTGIPAERVALSTFPPRRPMACRCGSIVQLLAPQVASSWICESTTRRLRAPICRRSHSVTGIRRKAWAPHWYLVQTT